MSDWATTSTTSFPGSLFSASLGRWKKVPGCGWSHYHLESGWQKNVLGGRGGRVFCLVDAKCNAKCDVPEDMDSTPFHRESFSV